MWPISEAARSWHDAMQAQDVHEAACRPCATCRRPVCHEGRRLQVAAREAYQGWVSDRYAAPQTLDDLDDCINGERPAGRLHQDITDVRVMPLGVRHAG